MITELVTRFVENQVKWSWNWAGSGLLTDHFPVYSTKNTGTSYSVILRQVHAMYNSGNDFLLRLFILYLIQLWMPLLPKFGMVVVRLAKLLKLPPTSPSENLAVKIRVQWYPYLPFSRHTHFQNFFAALSKWMTRRSRLLLNSDGKFSDLATPFLDKPLDVQTFGRFKEYYNASNLEINSLPLKMKWKSHFGWFIRRKNLRKSDVVAWGGF